MQRFWVISFFILSAATHAQRKAEIVIGSEIREFQFQDTLQLTSYLQKIQEELVADGYFFAGIDSVRRTPEGESRIYLHKGEKYTALVSGKKRALSSAKARLEHLVNHGYPFARVGFDSLRINEDQRLVGKLSVNKGPEIRLDSLILAQEIGTNPSYLASLLELRVDDLFSEGDYRSIDERIGRSPFLRMNKPQDIAFQDGRAVIFLDLTQSGASEFEGILGLQQNNQGGSTAIGSLRLDTYNLFQSGHQLNFLWERFSQESQNLNLHYKHAFLFGSSISPSFRFDLLKQDTSFFTRTAGIGINMFVRSDIRLSANFESNSASLISNDLEVIQGRALADYQRSFYRLELARGYTSFFSALNEGLAWSFSLGVGNKEIKRNLSLPDTYYDSISFSTEFVEMSGMLSYQLKVSNRNTIFHQLNFGALYNDELLTNELYRIGGLGTLRGFNEKEFFAERYLSSRVELRSFFENKSFFYLFYDLLFYKRETTNDSPFGLGFGFALETQSGQFNFALASGNSNRQSISFEELRVHFGYTANFK